MFQVNHQYSLSPPSKEENKTKQRIENNFEANLLDENDFEKFKIPDGSILKAISVGLYFTTKYSEKIKNFVCEYLRKIIQNNDFNERLAIFGSNVAMIRKFSKNVENIENEKTLLELTSLCYKVKICVYSISEDLYLTSYIVNNQFTNQIDLFKSNNNHFDVLFEKQKFESIKLSQRIVYELFNKVFHVNFPCEYKNIVVENDSIAKDEVANDESDKSSFPNIEFKQKPKHKKSLSDNFNVSHEQISKELNKYYEMFTNIKPPEDFIRNITPSKSRFAKDFTNESKKLNVDLTIINKEPQIRTEYFSNSLAIKNYNLSKSNMSSLNASFEKFKDDNLNENLNAHMGFKMQPSTNTPPGLTPRKVASYANNNNLIPDNMMKNHFGMYPGQILPGDNLINSLTPIENQNYFHTGVMNSLPPFQTSFSSTYEQKKPPIILDDGSSSLRQTGRLKFFDEVKNYGFIVMDKDGSDIFVHFDDLSKVGITKEILRTARMGNLIRFSFNCMKYIGKYNRSQKAVDLILLNH